MKKTTLFLVIVLFVTTNLYSQNQRVTLNMKDVTLEQIVKEIGRQAKLNLLYENSKVNLSAKKTVDVKNETVSSLLNNLFKESGIKYEIKSGQLILIPVPGKAQNSSAKQLTTRVVKGTVTDENGDPLPGATIFAKGTSKGTNSNLDGNFTIQISSNINKLTVSFI
ncbi:MAG: carboxypeptidase-like regulatory domain-containing protein, partial [Bacteroidales bacterium]